MEDTEPRGDVPSHAESVSAESDGPSSILEELEELFGGGAQVASERRDYIGEAYTAAQGVSDRLAARAAVYLPDEVAVQVSNNSLLVLSIVIFLLLALAVGLLLSLRRGPRRSTLLLCGPAGAGKTTLFYQLRGSPLSKGTVTSTIPNVETFKIAQGKASARPVTVVDLPGHPRLRSLLTEYIAVARGVIFVVDASEFVRQKTDIAGHLYDVLVALGSTGGKVPLLIACNKSDLGSRAFSTSFIVSTLEKDVRGLRQTRLAGLGQEGAGHTDHLCAPNATFTFATCPVPITSCSISAMEATLECVSSFSQSLGL